MTYKPISVESTAPIESPRVFQLLVAARFALLYHDEPCRGDHEGLCQAHDLEPLEYCWVKDLREALALFFRLDGAPEVVTKTGRLIHDR